MTRDTLIFDLDGTLAHTAPDLIATLNRICAPHDLPPVRTQDIGQIVGHGAKAMIRHVFELAGRPVEPPLVDALLAEFLKDYARNLANETRLFEGLEQAMDELEDAGFLFCVCTNKMERFAHDLLERLECHHRFRSITGGDTFQFRKPDPRHLEETVRAAGSRLERSIMIGDSSTDINAAIAAEVPSVAVTFGYSDLPVDTLGANAVINHFRELPQTARTLTQLSVS